MFLVLCFDDTRVAFTQEGFRLLTMGGAKLKWGGRFESGQRYWELFCPFYAGYVVIWEK